MAEEAQADAAELKEELDTALEALHAAEARRTENAVRMQREWCETEVRIK